MPKKLLQITFNEPKKFKTKFGKWFYNEIWFDLWHIRRPKVMSVIYGSLADFIYWLAPQDVKDKMDKELEEEIGISHKDLKKYGVFGEKTNKEENKNNLKK